jgi:hypothetical protein
MRPGRTGAEIEIAAHAVFVVMMLVAVRMLALVHMRVTVFAAVGMAMGMGMDAERRVVMRVAMLGIVIVGMAMHRSIFMDMGVLVSIPFDLRFPCATAANRTHSLVSSRTTLSLFP